MYRTTIIATAFLCLMLCQQMQAQSAGAFADSEWIGGSDAFGSAAFIHLVLPGDGKPGVVNVQSWRVFNRPTTIVRREGNAFHVEFASSTGTPFVLAGEVKEGVVTGTASRGEQKGKFHLIQVATIDRGIYDRYAGVYEFPDPARAGKVKRSLITFGALGHLRWLDLDTGDTMGLFPIGNNKFVFAGPMAATPDTSFAVWTFVNGAGGGPLSALVQVRGQPDSKGPRLDEYHQERIAIRNGKFTLAGTLIKPVSRTPIPAVVFAPGSNAVSRDEGSPFREFEAVLRSGTAILTYDKRGTGQSDGNWQDESYHDLAGDALAGVRYLKGRKDIDKKRIGIWGFSQGASIAPLAATMSRDVSFLILGSGGGVTNEEAELGDQIARMERQKLTEEEIKEATAFIKLQFEAAYSEAGWKAFQEALPIVANKRWLPRTWARIPRGDWWWRWWGMNGRYDPEPILRKVRVPVLATFGGSDELVPAGRVDAMAERLRSALNAGGNRNVTVRVFAGANHDISVRLADGRWVAPDGYHAVLTDWLRERVRNRESK